MEQTAVQTAAKLRGRGAHRAVGRGAFKRPFAVWDRVFACGSRCGRRRARINTRSRNTKRCSGDRDRSVRGSDGSGSPAVQTIDPFVSRSPSSSPGPRSHGAVQKTISPPSLSIHLDAANSSALNSPGSDPGPRARRRLSKPSFATASASRGAASAPKVERTHVRRGLLSDTQCSFAKRRSIAMPAGRRLRHTFRERFCTFAQGRAAGAP